MLPEPQRERLPETRESLTHAFSIFTREEDATVEYKGYVTVGLYDDGRVGEIFFKMDRAGSTLRGFADQWAISVSQLLQQGTTLESIITKYKGTRFEPSGRTSTASITVAKSPVDYIARYLERRFVLKLPLALTDDEKATGSVS